LEKFLGQKSFKIEKSKVKLSCCHPGVFVPVYTDAGEYSFKTASGASVAYWDEHAYASEWNQPGKEGTLTQLHGFYLTSFIVQQDDEVSKFYNDLKTAEVLHSTAATIIQGIHTH